MSRYTYGVAAKDLVAVVERTGLGQWALDSMIDRREGNGVFLLQGVDTLHCTSRKNEESERGDYRIREADRTEQDAG